ncbi:hypothetical protein M3Y99_01637300 [Aphelenchoides fujianensis]|nr:hypothetical protein M3Y99_01637300 [Aphelenchoides fujianensis]
MREVESFDPRPLAALALRSLTLHVFRATARWRKLDDVVRDLRPTVRRLPAPPPVKRQLLAALHEAANEVARWDEKHAKMFVDDEPPAARTSRAAHLLTFHDALVWDAGGLTIDDFRTAQRLVHDSCLDWPQLRFQFACCYAMVDVLENGRLFDVVRRRVFRKRLAGHPVFELWLRLLDDPRRRAAVHVEENRLLADQLCVQTLHFACTNGFVELARFFWGRLSPAQRESVGFLCWKKVCFRAASPAVVRFLCHELCTLNAAGMLCLTWDSFYFKVFESLEKDYATNPRAYLENMKKLELLLNNWCPRLRNALLLRDECRALLDAFWRQNESTFCLLLDHVDARFLPTAREVVERVFAKSRTDEKRRLRDALLRRQGG